MAFDFPDTSGLANGYRVINPKTGTEYSWMAASQKWVLVNSGATGDYVKKSGDIMSGPLMMSNGDLINPAPIDITADEQAVHKLYVDEAIEEFLPDLTDDLQQLDTIDERYVNKKGGDSMQGPLNISGGRNANTNGIEGTVKALNIDSGQNSSLQLKHDGNTRVYVGADDFTLIPNLKFNSGNKSIYSGNDKKGFTVTPSGVLYEGDYVNDKHVATKKDVEEAFLNDITDPDSNKFVKLDGDEMTGDLEVPNITVQNDINVADGSKLKTGSDLFQFNANGAFYEGVYNVDKHIATKKNVEESLFTDPTDSDSNIYLDRSGDSMEGQLQMANGTGIKFTGLRDSNKAIELSRNTGESPAFITLNHPGGSTLGGYDIKIGGNTSYNELRIMGGSNANTASATFKGNGNINIFKDVSFNNNKITKLANATADTDAVPYGQVVAEVKDAFGKILDVASQAEYSVWNSGSLVPGYMFPRNNSGSLKLRPSDITVIEFHKTDIAGLEADFNSLKDGDRLVLVDTDNSHVSKYRVDDPPTVSGDKYLVKIASGEGDDLELSHNVDIFFQEFQVGVDLDDYVKKAGDTMTGNLEINRTGADDQEASLTLKGKRPNTTNSVGTIAFQNNTNTTIGYLTYRASGTNGFFRFNRDIDLNNHKLLDVGQIDFNSPGILKVNGTDALNMRRAANGNDGNANFQIPRAPNARRTFAIRGQDTTGTERDVLYCYANATGGDAINYFGKQTADDHIATVGKVKDLVSSGGTDFGEAIQQHGAWHFAGIGASISPGQFTSDQTDLRKIRQFTFHKKNQDGDEQTWSDLQVGEIISIGQKGDFSGSGGAVDGWGIADYEVMEFQEFATAVIIDVSCHWTLFLYSNGSVSFNPSSFITWFPNVDTFVYESLPATLNNVVNMAKKASPAPAYYSFTLSSNTNEPLLGINRGQMIFSGGATIQNPGAIIVSGLDRYGNGIQSGSNSFECHGSTVELYRKNLDGSICLCRVYEFDRLSCTAKGDKITYRNLTLLYQASGGTPNVPNPGTMEAGAEYLVRHILRFDTSGTASLPIDVDAQGDLHFRDHRLEDVAEPVDGTDASTKHYVDTQVLGALNKVDDLLTVQTSPTNISINRFVNDAYYDEANNRIVMWRNYFGRTDVLKTEQLILVDPVTGDVQYKESANPFNANRKENISSPFQVGNDTFFVQAENPKDSEPIRLEPNGTFSKYGSLKFCRSWAVVNYHVKLTDRYRLFVGNPQLRVDANGGNHSQQAQVTLLLDTEDLINQNEVESYESNGTTYGTLTKTINTKQGGIPAVINKGEGVIPDVYLVQSGKTIKKVEINDLEQKDVNLTEVSSKLPVGYLVNHSSKFIAEKGRVNGLTVLQNRYIVFHLDFDGFYWFDTEDHTLTKIQDTHDQWIQYGVNRNGLTPAVPNFNDTLYYFPISTIGEDDKLYSPKLRIVNSDQTVEMIDIPYEAFSCISSQRINSNEILCVGQADDLYIFNVNSHQFSRIIASERGNIVYTGRTPEGAIQQQLLPWVTGDQDDLSTFLERDILQLKQGLDINILDDPAVLNNLQLSNQNEEAIISTRDGLADLIHSEVQLATEDETYKQPNLMELCTPCWPDADHPYYQLISQDYVLFHRMYEGSKKTEDDNGTILSNNETLDSDDYGNDDQKNLMIFHIPTGKIKDISVLISHNDSAEDIATGNAMDKYPSLRGKTVIPRSNGDVDVYSWIHNPRRKGISQPLVRIHIPANPNPSDPFAGVTTKHTNIKCELGLLTTPDANPYGNYVNTSKKYQYEISQFTWDLVDNETDERHHFMMSYNKGSKDYVTQRIFEINFDDSDPDEGTITPVDAHLLSTNGSFAAGIPVIKKDITGKNRCFLYGSPCALTELYFTGDDLLHRTVEMRNYADYTPQGTKRFHEEYVNGMGQQVIKEKGIYDNWYKSSTLSPQFLTQAPIDNNDYFTNIIVWYQGAYGVCSLNIQDLGVLDRQAETKFENNYQGSEDELSSMFSETKNTYLSYLQEGGSRNLHRFSTKLLDTHSHGKLYYFPYRADYVYDIKDDGSGINGNRTTLYNSTRKFDTDGNVIEEMLYKRSILEVSPNYITGLVEIRAIVTSKKHFPSGNEPENPEGFSGESVVKFGDVFVCSSSSKSHSSITDPKVYIFDPHTRSIQKVSDTTVESTSLIACPQHGLVIGSSYGLDSNDQNTPVHLTTMTANPSVMQDRKTARTLRKLYAVTGDSVANDPDTWSESPAQTGLPTPNPADFDSNEAEWDAQES